MCLYLRDKVKHIATSNIYVWKALIKNINGYYSPVLLYKYDIGKTYKSELSGDEQMTLKEIIEAFDGNNLADELASNASLELIELCK